MHVSLLIPVPPNIHPRRLSRLLRHRRPRLQHRVCTSSPRPPSEDPNLGVCLSLWRPALTDSRTFYQVFLLIFTIFTQLSANIGFGQSLVELERDMERVTQATLYECIGQGFAIIGMAIAKCSLGLFLLRLISAKWQKLTVWSAMVLVTLASIGRCCHTWSSSTACFPILLTWFGREQHSCSASGCHVSLSRMSTTSAL